MAGRRESWSTRLETMNSSAAETSHKAEQPTCPSGRCREGAILLGIIGADGLLGYATPKITIDADFVASARLGRKPESRFRFAEPCLERQCQQWIGSRCGLIDQVLASPDGARVTQGSEAGLPGCVVRPSCRWFLQVGARACSICPHIVHSTEYREE